MEASMAVYLAGHLAANWVGRRVAMWAASTEVMWVALTVVMKAVGKDALMAGYLAAGWAVCWAGAMAEP